MKQPAIIIGTGRFGYNYVHALAELNRQALSESGDLFFDPLIVTRTNQAAAQDTAGKIKASFGDCFSSVIGATVETPGSLQPVLETYRPVLIAIPARDRQIGDRIHAVYTPIALNYGFVLCEKPFSEATGDGTSLEAIRLLQSHPFGHRFAMHLPMAVVLRAMLRDNYIGSLLAEADKIDFLWQKQNESPDLISDLVLHPWSLIPACKDMSVEKVLDRNKEVEIRLRRKPSEKEKPRKGHIIINSKGMFRGMRLNSTVLQFDFIDGKLIVMSLDADWDKILSGEKVTGPTNVLLRVDNPLRQHIRALMDGQPVIDRQQTYQCQLFLETIKGYTAARPHKPENANGV